MKEYLRLYKTYLRTLTMESLTREITNGDTSCAEGRARIRAARAEKRKRLKKNVTT